MSSINPTSTPSFPIYTVYARQQQTKKQFEIIMQERGYYSSDSLIEVEGLIGSVSEETTELELHLTSDQMQKVNIAVLQRLSAYPAMQYDFLHEKMQKNETEHPGSTYQSPNDATSTLARKMFKSLITSGEKQIENLKIAQTSSKLWDGSKISSNAEADKAELLSDEMGQKLKQAEKTKEVLEEKLRTLQATPKPQETYKKELENALQRKDLESCFDIFHKATTDFPKELWPYYPFFLIFYHYLHQEDFNRVVDWARDVDFHLAYAALFPLLQIRTSDPNQKLLSAMQLSYPRDEILRMLSEQPFNQVSLIHSPNFWESLSAAHISMTKVDDPCQAGNHLHTLAKACPGLAIPLRFLALDALVKGSSACARQVSSCAKQLMDLNRSPTWGRVINDVVAFTSVAKMGELFSIKIPLTKEEQLLDKLIELCSKNSCSSEDLIDLLSRANVHLQHGCDNIEYLVYIDIGLRLIPCKIIEIQENDIQAVCKALEPLTKAIECNIEQAKQENASLLYRLKLTSIQQNLDNLRKSLLDDIEDTNQNLLTRPLWLIRSLKKENYSSVILSACTIPLHPYFVNAKVLEFTFFTCLHRSFSLADDLCYAAAMKYYPFIKDTAGLSDIAKLKNMGRTEVEVRLALAGLQNRDKQPIMIHEDNLFFLLLDAYRCFSIAQGENLQDHQERLTSILEKGFIAPNFSHLGQATFSGFKDAPAESDTIPMQESDRAIYKLMASSLNNTQAFIIEHNQKIDLENTQGAITIDKWQKDIERLAKDLKSGKKDPKKLQKEELEVFSKIEHNRAFEALKEKTPFSIKNENEFLIEKAISILNACEEKRDDVERDVYVPTKTLAFSLYCLLFDISFYRLLTDAVIQAGPSLWCSMAPSQIHAILAKSMEKLQAGYHGPERHLVGKGPIEEHFNACCINSKLSGNNVHIFFSN